MNHRFSILFLLLFSFRFAEAQPNTFFKLYYTSPQISYFSSVIERPDGKFMVLFGGSFPPDIKDRVYLIDNNGDTLYSKNYCSREARSIIQSGNSIFLYVTSSI